MVSLMWPIIWNAGCEITFAHTSFKWANLASHNAGVTVVIVGIGRASSRTKSLYESDDSGQLSLRSGANISPYLTLGTSTIVQKARDPISDIAVMEFGNKPSDGGNLLVSPGEVNNLKLSEDQKRRFLRKIVGSQDFINGGSRYCVWIEDSHVDEALRIESLSKRVELVRQLRLASPDKGARAFSL